MKLLFRSLLALFFIAPAFLLAQENHKKCGVDILEEHLHQRDADYALLRQQADALIEQQILLNKQEEERNGKTAGIVYTIPVVVHVIYGDYRDNIGRAQIEDALRVLNEDFRRQNNDASNTRSVFQSVAADVEVEFKLAKKDPDGNCTDGINRVQSAMTVDARDNVKSLIMWPRDKYLNIWTVRSIDVSSSVPGIVLGYAYRPTPGQTGTRDGIVIRHDRMGTIGTGAGISLGRTLTHEVGHYLGLQHPFVNACSAGNDGIADTPPVFGPSFGCPLNANTCTNDSPDLPDMIENYMDYADDNCTNLFTEGQKTLMRAVLTNASLRASIKSSANLTATGVTDPPACTPTAFMAVEKTLLCAGESTTFFDLSEDGDPTAWQWSFGGGTPATSTQQNPTIQYNTPGSYDVSLTVSNAAGADSKTFTGKIQVKQPYDVYYPNWAQSFEDATIPMPEITLEEGGDEISFELFAGAGSDGNQCLKLDNFNVDIEEEIDAVISPAITTIFTQDLDLSFDVAFARKENTNTDEIRVLASTDCGETWVLRRFFRGASLATASNTTASFVPTAADWQTLSVGFDAYAGPDPLLVKVEFESGGGNNIYLDNFRFTGTIGEKENQLLQRFELYPNPSKGQFQVAVEMQGRENLRLELSGLDGKLIMVKEVEVNQTARLDFDTRLPAGVYLLKAIAGDRVETKKVLVE